MFICSIAAGKKRDFRFHPIKEAVIEEPADITPWLPHLDDAMKEKVQQLQKTRWDNEIRALGSRVCANINDADVSTVTQRHSVR